MSGNISIIVRSSEINDVSSSSTKASDKHTISNSIKDIQGAKNSILQKDPERKICFGEKSNYFGPKEDKTKNVASKSFQKFNRRKSRSSSSSISKESESSRSSSLNRDHKSNKYSHRREFSLDSKNKRNLRPLIHSPKEKTPEKIPYFIDPTREADRVMRKYGKSDSSKNHRSKKTRHSRRRSRSRSEYKSSRSYHRSTRSRSRHRKRSGSRRSSNRERRQRRDHRNNSRDRNRRRSRSSSRSNHTSSIIQHPHSFIPIVPVEYPFPAAWIPPHYGQIPYPMRPSILPPPMPIFPYIPRHPIRPFMMPFRPNRPQRSTYRPKH